MRNWCERCGGSGYVFTVKTYPGETFWQSFWSLLKNLFHVPCPLCETKGDHPAPPLWDAQVKYDSLSQEYKENLKLYGLGYPDDEPHLEIFTCARCHIVKQCNLAFDAYNTNGDCLADK